MAKAFVAEALSEHAQALFEGPEQLCMPAHGLAELAEVLRRHVRDGVIGDERFQQALTAAPEEVEQLPVSDFLLRAATLGLELDISVYDALYVALAEREATTLISWNLRLLRRVAASPYAHLAAPLNPSWTP